MKFFTDDYFHIGTAHLTSGKPCQDYAIADAKNGMALAIISDGCSGGGRTDIGSRVLALSTATALRENWQMNGIIDRKKTPIAIAVKQEIVLTGAQNMLGLATNDMLATCLYAYISAEGGFIFIQGDGVVAIKYRDERIVMTNFEWLENKPFYPVYKNGLLANFIKAHKKDLQGKRFRSETWEFCTNEELLPLDVDDYSLSAGIQGITIPILKKALKEEIEFIAVFSDGITQVDNSDWKEAVVDFMAFKNVRGEFAKRRMIRGIKDTQKIGRGPIDDISYAVIRIDTAVEEVDDED